MWEKLIIIFVCLVGNSWIFVFVGVDLLIVMWFISLLFVLICCRYVCDVKL